MKKTEMKNIAKMIAERNNETIIKPSIFIGDIDCLSMTTYDNEFGSIYEYFINFKTNKYMRKRLSSSCLHKSHIYDF